MIADVIGEPGVVSQDAGEATVRLSRSDTAGSLRVEVTTAPSPYVGVNVGAVDQTVTFAAVQRQATLTVPILSGARNPGDVSVNLTAKIIDPAPAVPPVPFVLDLRIVASDPTLPPKVVSIVATSQDIVLRFNKPMNPAGASNVKDYAVSVVNDSMNSWPLKSAEYDPATQTVTLIPKHPNLNIHSLTTATRLHRVRTSVRARHQSNAAPGLTDLQGNPVNADTTPGQVAIRLAEPLISVSFLTERRRDSRRWPSPGCRWWKGSRGGRGFFSASKIFLCVVIMRRPGSDLV
jgi:hypothetical protein